jgi:hypothetical protein
VTEFDTDFVNIEMDVSDPDGITTVQRIWAWYVYVMFSADGIRNWFGGIEAIDDVNYLIYKDIVNLKLDNVSVTPVRLTGGRLYRDDGSTIISASSYSIQIDPSRVYSVQTGISGLTPDESDKLLAIGSLEIAMTNVTSGVGGIVSAVNANSTLVTNMSTTTTTTASNVVKIKQLLPAVL